MADTPVLDVRDDNKCEHGRTWAQQCAKCNRNLKEAQVAGAITPNEIGIYFRGKKAGILQLYADLEREEEQT